MVGLNYRLRGRQLQRHNNNRTADRREEEEEEEGGEGEEKSLQPGEPRKGLTVSFTEGRAVTSSLVTNNRGREGEAVVEL